MSNTKKCKKRCHKSRYRCILHLLVIIREKFTDTFEFQRALCYYHIYPTPQLRLDTTQRQFLSGV